MTAIDVISLFGLTVLMALAGQMLRVILKLKTPGETPDSDILDSIDVDEKDLLGELQGDINDYDKVLRPGDLETKYLTAIRKKNEPLYDKKKMMKDFSIAFAIGLLLGVACFAYLFMTLDQSPIGGKSFEVQLSQLLAILFLGYGLSDATDKLLGLREKQNTIKDRENKGRKGTAGQKKLEEPLTVSSEH